jgi:hypothetical protein
MPDEAATTGTPHDAGLHTSERAGRQLLRSCPGTTSSAAESRVLATTTQKPIQMGPGVPAKTVESAGERGGLATFAESIGRRPKRYDVLPGIGQAPVSALPGMQPRCDRSREGD